MPPRILSPRGSRDTHGRNWGRRDIGHGELARGSKGRTENLGEMLPSADQCDWCLPARTSPHNVVGLKNRGHAEGQQRKMSYDASQAVWLSAAICNTEAVMVVIGAVCLRRIKLQVPQANSDTHLPGVSCRSWAGGQATWLQAAGYPQTSLALKEPAAALTMEPGAHAQKTGEEG
ncbi:hypothetical protein NDU88_006106 [Pleurodeles waltl]|uniref:Uncharacterized protein n=1 Tax=Pleurodeles waltl TaxID=8319 RepID=A0AAV7TD81_PLEWA|nr:hypothetical protein NDU88_006106 [Pleurodeles waltl]